MYIITNECIIINNKIKCLIIIIIINVQYIHIHINLNGYKTIQQLCPK